MPSPSVINRTFKASRGEPDDRDMFFCGVLLIFHTCCVVWFVFRRIYREDTSVKKGAAPDAKGAGRTSVRRGSAAEGARRGSAVMSGEGAAGGAMRRGSAARPNSQNSRLSHSASKQASSQQT